MSKPSKSPRQKPIQKQRTGLRRKTRNLVDSSAEAVGANARQQDGLRDNTDPEALLTILHHISTSLMASAIVSGPEERSECETVQQPSTPTADDELPIEIRRKRHDSIEVLTKAFEFFLGALVKVAEQDSQLNAQIALRCLIDRTVLISKWLIKLGDNPNKADVLRQLAGYRFEWPSIYTPFGQTNAEYQKAASSLGLSMSVPIKIAPNKSSSPYNRLAIRILQQIDSCRDQPQTIVARAIPDIVEKPFCRKHRLTWRKAAGFFMDYFMAPKERQRDTADKFNLLEEWLFSEELRSDPETDVDTARRRRSLDWCGEITAMEEFTHLLQDERDRSVQSTGDLYNRVRSRVLDRIDALYPDLPE